MLWCNAVTVDPTNRLMCCRRSVETGEPFTGVLENRRKPGGQGVQFACGGGGHAARMQSFDNTIVHSQLLDRQASNNTCVHACMK